jgi:hypothetical protein
MRKLSTLVRAITPVVRRIWLRWRNWQWLIPGYLRNRHEFNSLEPRRLLDGSGFSYQEFGSTALGTPVGASGTVSDINQQFPSNPITSDQTPFHVIYSGTFSLTSEQAGTYYFELPAAEGGILTIDGHRVFYEPGLPGDANLDGTVDFTDLAVLLSNYGESGLQTWRSGDFDGDGTVGPNDLALLLATYGSTDTPTSIDNAGDNQEGLTLGVSLSAGNHDLELDYYQFNDDENSLDQYPSAELLWSNSSSGTYYDLSDLSMSPFPPPTDLSATFEGSSFELHWSGDSSASYNIYESSNPDFAAISADLLTSDITATSYGVAMPSVGSDEYFLVTELNSVGDESPASNEVGIGYNNVSVQTQNTPITIDPSPGAYFGSSPSISSISGGAHGSVSAAGVGEGKVIYTPSTSFTGNDSFSYLVSGPGAVPTEYGVDISIEGYGNPNVQSVGSGGSYQGQRAYILNDDSSIVESDYASLIQSASGNFEFDSVYSTTMVNTGDTYAGTDTLTTIVDVTLSVSASESAGEAWSYYERATLSTDVSTTHPGTVDGVVANSLTADTYTFAAEGDTTSYQYSLSGHETYNDTGTADAGGTDTTWTATGTYTGNFSRIYESAGSSYTNSATESGNDSMSEGAYADSTETNITSFDTFSYVPTLSLQENTYSYATSTSSSTDITLYSGELTGVSWDSQSAGYVHTTTSEQTFSAGSWHSAGNVNSYDFSYQNATATAAGDFTYDVAGGSVVGPGTYSFSDYSTSQDDRSYSWYDASTATTSWDSQTDGNVTSDSWHGSGSHAEGYNSSHTLTGTITLGGYVVSGTDHSVSTSLEAGTLVTVANESDDYGSGSYGGSYSGTGWVSISTALGTIIAADHEAGSLTNSYETSQHYDFGTLDGGTATSSESYGYSQSVNGSANYTHTPEGVTVTGAQFYTGTYSGNDLSTSDGSADGSGDWVTTDINEPSYSEFASLSYSGAGNYTTSFGNVTAASGVYYEGGSTMSSIHEYSTMTDADGTSSTTGSGGESYSAVDTFGYDAEGLAAGSSATTGEGEYPLIATSTSFDVYVESGNEGHTEETTVSLVAVPDGTWRSAYAGSSTLATAEGEASYNYNDSLSLTSVGDTFTQQGMDSGTVYQSFEYGFNNNYSLHISADGTSTGGGFGSGAGSGFGTAAESKTTSSDNGYTSDFSGADSYFYASNWSQYYDVSGSVEPAGFSATNDQMGDYSSSVSSSLDPVGNGTYSGSYDTIVSTTGFYSQPYCSYTNIQPSKEQMTLGSTGYDSDVDIVASLTLPDAYQLDYDMLTSLTFVLDA